ncbi:MAG TPA: hypothetical protein VGE64_04095 [Xanthomonadaceae bacterium]
MPANEQHGLQESHSREWRSRVCPMHIDQTERTNLQSDLRGMAAMLCGLRCDADNRRVPLDDPSA